MKVLFLAAEAAPFAKTGGLGDVIGSLPIQLKKKRIDVRVILPWYRDIPEEYKKNAEVVASGTVNIGWREQEVNLWQLKHNGVQFYFIDQPYYFDRSGIYGYFDDGERFAFFSRAALAMLEKIDFIPDILHAHDWHTGLIPLYLNDYYQTKEVWKKTKSIFTIHNLAYQGKFPAEILEDILGLNWDYYTEDKLELNDSVNLMKGGILYANAVTTVSKTYATEIQTAERGEGLDLILKKCSKKLCGIVNGLDYESYNPWRDKALCTNFHQGTQQINRKKNKEWLFERCQFEGPTDAPVIGIVSRITWEKGFDLVLESIPDIIESGAKLIILGTGDSYYEEKLRNIAVENRGSVEFVAEFNDQLARNIYGGSDIFLMPSLFEPCGISQLIAMRYGSVPLVHATGGLKDTVRAYQESTGEGNGFSFSQMTRADFLKAYFQALAIYQKKTKWNALVKQVMAEDFSWSKSVEEYRKLYKCVVEGGRKIETYTNAAKNQTRAGGKV